MTRQRIFVAGHRGMVGSAIVRQLEQRGDVELVLRTRDQLNLLDSKAPTTASRQISSTKT
jgi:GDP-L-fucose synthase